jgi:hypothetical protein
MSSTAADALPQNPILKALYRPPYIGILAFVAAFLPIGLAHALMVLTEYVFGEANRYLAAFAMGALSIYMLWLGVKLRREAIGTWLGFFAGTLVWTSWVEFAFMYYGRVLYPVPVQIENGGAIQYPEYMMMTTSIGVLGSSFFYWFFNKETRCNFFVWFHRRLGLDMGERTSGKERNIAAITFMETVAVTWTFYLAQLAIYDPALIGADHWIAYAAFLACFVWGAYLFTRLIKYKRVSSAVRYAIPTSIILWCDVEFLSRWNMLTEFWLRPWDFWKECTLLLVGCVMVTVLVMKSPKKLSETEAV